ncbi:MAG: DNA polymerase domain-containing protein [Candidatus Heimdallarchaeaceae archaeon]
MKTSSPPLRCFVVDLDFFIEEKEKGIEEPIIRIRAKDQSNKPLVLHIIGFYPYFYIDDLRETTKTIQSLLYTEKEFGAWIKGSYPVSKFKYYQNKPIFLRKILGRNPWRVLRYSRILQTKGIKSYENDISYTSRFLIDTNIKGLNWVEIKNYKEKGIENNSKVLEVNYENITPIEDNPLPLTLLSLNLNINSINPQGKKIRNFSSIMDEGKQRIISMSICWGTEGSSSKPKNRTFILEQDTDESEKQLIEKVIKEIHSKNPEILITFNGNRITLPYLLKRMKNLGLNPNSLSQLNKAKIKLPIGYLGYRIPGLISYDLIKSTRWLRTKSGKKGLTDLANEYLKIKRKGDYETINKLWFEWVIQKKGMNKRKIQTMNSQDANITYALFDAMGMTEWLEVMKLVGLRPSEAVYSTPRHIGEFQVFRILHEKDTIIPSEPSKKELVLRKSNRAMAVGGFVLVPKGTLHEAVLIADFRSMFPSITVAYNIGGESYDSSVAEPKKKFRSEPDTALKIMEKQILGERKELKKKIYDMEIYLRTFTKSKVRSSLETKLKKLKTKSSALKIVANSLYGSHNYIGSRFFNTDISNAITSISKEYIKNLDKWTQELTKGKCQVIYGDTDSIFVKLSEKQAVFDVYANSKKGEIFSISDVPEVKNLLKYFKSKLPKEMELEFVDLALRIVFAPETKKRYSYVSAVSQELTIVGFEAIRSDTSPFAAEVQKEALKLVLEEGSISKARDKVIELCLYFETLEGKELIEKTTILGPIRRNPNEYKSKTPAIGALEDYAKTNHLNINEIWKDFDRFPFIIQEGNVALYKRSKHPSLVIPSKIDKEHYLREALRDVHRIGVKVEIKDVRTSSQKTLDHTLQFLNKRKKRE